eukprot:5452265-Prymnesium_polylepis.1
MAFSSSGGSTASGLRSSSEVAMIVCSSPRACCPPVGARTGSGTHTHRHGWIAQAGEHTHTHTPTHPPGEAVSYTHLRAHETLMNL